MQLIVGLSVSVLAVVLLLRQVSLAELGELLARAELLPMVGLVATIVGGLLARAMRWGIYFLPDRSIPFRPLFGTLSISYMASTFLPFRAGEVVRAVFLSQREAVAFPRVVGTIVLEKLFDFLAIGLMLLWLLFTTPLPAEVSAVGGSIALAILGGFGFVVLLAVWREPMLSFLARLERLLPFGLGARLRLRHAAAQFAAGTDSLAKGSLWLPMLGWTAVAWIMATLGCWLGALALGVPLSLAAVTFLVVVTSTGQAVPSSPGYVGVYHAAAVLALTTFGIPPASALAIAVLTHALSYGSLVLVGLAALWLGGYGFGELWATARQRPSVATTS